MMNSDDDIEFLDEDADIVQQCVQTVTPLEPLVPEGNNLLTPRLVERPVIQAKRPLSLADNSLLTPRVKRPAYEGRRKSRRKDEDSDYNPDEDYVPPSPPNPKTKKKKQYAAKKQPRALKSVTPNRHMGQKVITSASNVIKKIPIINKFKVDRKTLDIRIPDYDDPLCLPVKAIRTQDSDKKRLKNWNYVCLEHFKHCDTLLKPEKGETQSSIRTMVFKNVTNKHTGKIDTTLWTKTSVENEEGDRKSEIFQSLLPRYREKKTLSFRLINRRPKPFTRKDEVILSKEQGKSEEVLVVYKPAEAMSAVYKLMKPSVAEERGDAEDKEGNDHVQRYMKEVACCKMCSGCFQASWRGVRNNTQRSIECPICGRTSVTIYNLLAHFKTHTAKDIQPCKKIISSILAEVIEYHYRCRLCREQCNSIHQLRTHVKTHKASEPFTCEVGNHVTR